MLGPKPVFRPKIPSTTSETSDLDIGKELFFHNALSWIVLQNMSIFKQTKCSHLNSRSITARVTEHHRDEHQLYSTWPWQHRFVWKILFTQVGLICFTTWPRQCRLIWIFSVFCYFWHFKLFLFPVAAPGSKLTSPTFKTDLASPLAIGGQLFWLHPLWNHQKLSISCGMTNVITFYIFQEPRLKVTWQ